MFAIRNSLKLGSMVFGLSALVLIPAPLGWFTYLYAAVGFGINYALCLFHRKA
ncbi:hypothetical protein [uncultured Aurantimicrobium sp.]|uniref:hypothetical protein n=1 Tax=uncultured Aurantimicrobium sp. TaxID=1705357 RepID=UPI00262FD5A2|nr:hypothetical protein [uncultured Aurantimicrobium sp.]